MSRLKENIQIYDQSENTIDSTQATGVEQSLITSNYNTSINIYNTS